MLPRSGLRPTGVLSPPWPPPCASFSYAPTASPTSRLAIKLSIDTGDYDLAEALLSVAKAHATRADSLARHYDNGLTPPPMTPYPPASTPTPPASGGAA
jgi:hypothetical protein